MKHRQKMIQFLLRGNKTIILFLLLLNSCTNERNLNLDTTVIEYFPDGHIKSIKIQKSGDSQNVLLLFDSTGILRNYENKNKNATYTQLSFYPSGNLQQKNSIKNGSKEGTSLRFYEHGNIETINYSKDGRYILDGIEYYDTPFLKAKSATYYNDSGRAYYKEHFSFEGDVIKKEGVLKK